MSGKDKKRREVEEKGGESWGQRMSGAEKKESRESRREGRGEGTKAKDEKSERTRR